MMKGFDEQEGKSIDEFYGESKEENKSLNQNIDFDKKLEQTSEKLDILNEDIFDFHIDTLDIIEKADGIREGKRFKIEISLFLSTGLLILCLYGFLGLNLGYKFILSSQVVLMFIIPWVIVPISVKRRRSEI